MYFNVVDILNHRKQWLFHKICHYVWDGIFTLDGIDIETVIESAKYKPAGTTVMGSLPTVIGL